MEDKAGYLTGIGSVVLGLIFLAMPMYTYLSTAGSENWPFVYGTIIRSEIFSTMVSSRTRGSSVQFSLYLEYEYSVNSIKYTSTRVSTRVYNIQETQKQYPLNTEAKVYYNPNDHSIALLIPGDKLLEEDAWFVWGVVIIIAGIIIFGANIYFAIKKSKEEFPFSELK